MPQWLQLSILTLPLLAAPVGPRQHSVLLNASGSNARGQRCDSSCMVRAAARALDSQTPGKHWRVSQFQRTDSGTVVTLTIPPQGRLVTMGGGGTVLVGTSGKARILKRFR
jgi:hypothetical protein